jgi:hypothetical protein
MHGRKIKIGIGLVAAVAAAMALFPAMAQADYAPASKDVVGVGSDTLQALTDFAADGSYVADPGYNGSGNKNKFISFDATADANTRLAYGPAGGNGAGTNAANAAGTLASTTPNGCGPGTGAAIATGNATSPDTTVGDFPCVLNPTIVLRAGQSPEQRPNGSGAGYALLAADTVTTTGEATADGQALGSSIGNGTFGTVNYARASAPQNNSSTNFDSITVGTDNLAMLSAATGTTNAVVASLSTANLTAIYNCTKTTWNTVGGTSSATIVPLLPQVGSGTRKVFLADIGVTTPGTCVRNVEENDPEAIADSGDPANAIEPMASTRLNLFQGLLGTGGNANGAATAVGYFNDPSCPFSTAISSLNGVAGVGTKAPTTCQGTAATLKPQVHEWLSGSGTSSAPYDDNRNLYIYFRDADVFSPTVWQTGGSLNWVRTMFYNPCTASITSKTILTSTTTPTAAQAGCSLDSFGNEVGPGGAPFFDAAGGQQDIADAGVVPGYVINLASV